MKVRMSVKHLSTIKEAAVTVGKCKRPKKSEWLRKCQKEEKGQMLSRKEERNFSKRGALKLKK
jgi:hypothetical protein